MTEELPGHISDRKVLSREEYPKLYEAIDAWKHLEGAEFVLPDLRKRFDKLVADHYSETHERSDDSQAPT